MSVCLCVRVHTLSLSLSPSPLSLSPLSLFRLFSRSPSLASAWYLGDGLLASACNRKFNSLNMRANPMQKQGMSDHFFSFLSRAHAKTERASKGERERERVGEVRGRGEKEKVDG